MSGGRTVADRARPPAMRRASPLPPPEEVFCDWLLSLPAGADLAVEARRQVERIDRRAIAHPDLDALRLLLVAMTCAEETRPLDRAPRPAR